MQLPGGRTPPLLYGKLIPVPEIQTILAFKETARFDAVEHDHEILQWLDLKCVNCAVLFANT